MANSSSAGVNVLNAEDLPTAPEPKPPSRRQLLVVVGGAEDEDEDEIYPYDRIQTGTPDNQLSPTEERSTSSRIRSPRHSL